MNVSVFGLAWSLNLIGQVYIKRILHNMPFSVKEYSKNTHLFLTELFEIIYKDIYLTDLCL